MLKPSLAILYLLLRFPLPRFPPLHFWCRDFHSSVFHPCILVPRFPHPRFQRPPAVEVADVIIHNNLWQWAEGCQFCSAIYHWHGRRCFLGQCAMYLLCDNWSKIPKTLKENVLCTPDRLWCFRSWIPRSRFQRWPGCIGTYCRPRRQTRLWIRNSPGLHSAKFSISHTLLTLCLTHKCWLSCTKTL